MFELELRKSIHSKSIIYIIAITATAFILGWILPVGIDKVNMITYSDYLFSTYTVFTQFGFLMFSFVTAYFINKEYKEKTILFYQSFNINSIKFYLMKILVLIIEEIICIAIGLTIISIFFNDFRFYFSSLLLFTAVISQYFIIVGIISMIFDNMLISLGISIIYWLLTIILITFGGIFKYLAIFDASNELYDIIEKYFNCQLNSIPFQNVISIIIELTGMFIIAILIAFLLNRRWRKSGL